MATQWPQPVLQHGRLTMYHNTPDHYVWLAQHTAGYHQTTTCLRTRSRRSLQTAPTQRPKLSVRPASHPNGPNLGYTTYSCLAARLVCGHTSDSAMSLLPSHESSQPLRLSTSSMTTAAYSLKNILKTDLTPLADSTAPLAST